MKLSELEMIAEKLQTTEQNYLKAIQNYLDALDKMIHHGCWWKIDFDKELTILKEIDDWTKKKLEQYRCLLEKEASEK